MGERGAEPLLSFKSRGACPWGVRPARLPTSPWSWRWSVLNKEFNNGGHISSCAGPAAASGCRGRLDVVPVGRDARQNAPVSLELETVRS